MTKKEGKSLDRLYLETLQELNQIIDDLIDKLTRSQQIARAYDNIIHDQNELIAEMKGFVKNHMIVDDPISYNPDVTEKYMELFYGE